jgi:Ca2+-binding EF-hand superfamily protein
LREAFELFDAGSRRPPRIDCPYNYIPLSDNDGKITTAELSHLLRKLGYAPTQKQVEAMIKAFDEDGDGTADLQEFIHLMTMRITERDELLEAFRKFDTNQDGLFSGLVPRCYA